MSSASPSVGLLADGGDDGGELLGAGQGAACGGLCGGGSYGDSDPRAARRRRVCLVVAVLVVVGLVGLVLVATVAVLAGGGVSADDGLDDGASVTDAEPTTVVLVSLDGFRHMYLEDSTFAEAAPFILSMAEQGVRASQGMKPVFPTKTFPNHYSLVTGLYPESHGIIANTIYSPVFDATFTISDPAAVTDSRWWLGEPVWVTNERQGGVSAAMFWPGSEAPIKGIRPSYYYPYDSFFPYQKRFDQVLEWLKMPSSDAQRPNFICVYVDFIDTLGHEWGPSSPNILQGISLIDSLLQNFVGQIDADPALKDSVQVILSGDHGMMQGLKSRVVLLDQVVNLTRDVERVVDWSPNAYIIPRGAEGSPERTAHEDSILAAVNAHPHLRGWRKADIPAAWVYNNSDRITPIFVAASDGYQISSTTNFDRNPRYYEGGFHGLNNSAPEMQTLFIGHGSRFKSATDIESISNVEVYNILCELLDITPAPNNGTADLYQTVLK